MILAVNNRGHHVFPRSTVAFEFIGDHSSRRLALVLQYLAEKPFSSTFITPFLNKDIDHVIILIDGAPEIISNAIDRDENLIHKPHVAQSPLSFAKLTRVLRSEFKTPLPDRLIRNNKAALSQQILSITKT